MTSQNAAIRRAGRICLWRRRQWDYTFASHNFGWYLPKTRR